MDRVRLLQAVLWIYVAGSLLGCVLLLVGRVGNVNDVNIAATTTGKILGLGSLVSLAYGAARAALDPARNKVVVQVLILFTALAALAILYRLFVEGENHTLATWTLLLLAVAGPVLMVALYPRGTASGQRTGASEPAAPADAVRAAPVAPQAGSPAAPVGSAGSSAEGGPAEGDQDGPAASSGSGPRGYA